MTQRTRYFLVGSSMVVMVVLATGLVAYTLYGNPAVRMGAGAGLLIVQMVTAERIQIETFPGSTATTASFTSASLFYVR